MMLFVKYCLGVFMFVGAFVTAFGYEFERAWSVEYFVVIINVKVCVVEKGLVLYYSVCESYV